MIRLKVKEVAKQQGMSMGKLSRTAGVAYNTIRTIYKDPYRQVTTLTLDKLARALNVPVTELLEQVEDQTD